MSFFRKWKAHYRHKKFKSEDATDDLDWKLKKLMKNTTGIEERNLNVSGSIIGDEEHNKPLFASYNVKYMGCTPIDSKRSEKATSEAIKTVINNNKAGGRKNKTLKSVILNISEEGVDMLEQQTRNSLMRYSIYQISYCSVDAAHEHTFSFVISETDPLSDQEKLSCHVYQCSKRKISHEITLMVARCFENAYQHWRDTVVQQSLTQGKNLNSINSANAYQEKTDDSDNHVELNVEVHDNKKFEQKNENLLIDLTVTDTKKDVIQYLQNSWVSFEDDLHEPHRIVAY